MPSRLHPDVRFNFSTPYHPTPSNRNKRQARYYFYDCYTIATRPPLTIRDGMTLAA